MAVCSKLAMQFRSAGDFLNSALRAAYTEESIVDGSAAGVAGVKEDDNGYNDEGVAASATHFLPVP